MKRNGAAILLQILLEQCLPEGDAALTGVVMVRPGAAWAAGVPPAVQNPKVHLRPLHYVSRPPTLRSAPACRFRLYAKQRTNSGCSTHKCCANSEVLLLGFMHTLGAPAHWQMGSPPAQTQEELFLPPIYTCFVLNLFCHSFKGTCGQRQAASRAA